ncbi:MAG: hypothetical protein ACPLXC_01515 [Candidatus Pacearchaeota archaeon]
MPNKTFNKKQNKNPRYVRICPRCRSLNIKVSNQGGSAGTYFGLPTVYKCQNCGYSNYTFPEIDLNEFKRRKEENENDDN